MASIVTPENAKRNARIIDLYTQGRDFWQIIQMVGVSRGVVAGVIRRAGVKNRGGFKLPFRDITGQRFGRLTAICFEGRREHNGQKRWRCRCDCGAITVADLCSLTSGNTKSCGCLARELSRQRLRMRRAA
jgi:hypothetical protein